MWSLLPNVRSRLWAPVLVWVCLMGGPVMAQPDDDAGTPDAGQDEQQTDPDGEVPVTDQPGGIQSVDEETGGDDEEDEAEGSGAGRFIPSEQISQDLGVSFPADI